MANTKQNIIPVGNWNKSGLSDSKWSGVKDSFYKLIGWDMHSTPGLLKVAQKMTKDSGSTVTELCKVAIASSNGAQYWFSADSGKIWEKTSGGTWRLVHTTTPAAGAAPCLGAAEYDGYIYWATQSRLHRITVATADDNNWAVDATEDYATFGVTNASYHPMVEQNEVLYIGDDNQVAQVDAGTFSANAVDLPSHYVITSLGKIGTDILIGTTVGSSVGWCKIFRWNTWSVSFQADDEVPETAINAFLPADNMVFVQAGGKGNIYVYTNDVLEQYRKIPGDYSLGTMTMSAYSVGRIGDEILFGVSNSSGNPVDQGVYRIGRNSRNYDYIMDLPYPISERTGSDFVLTGLTIGAILVVGTDIYVAWKNGSSYGVDKLDTSNKLNGAYFETRVASLNREVQMNIAKTVVAYASLPAGTDISLYYDKNYAGYGSALGTLNDTDRYIIETNNEMMSTNTVQLKIKITASSNSAPEIESCGMFPT